MRTTQLLATLVAAIALTGCGSGSGGDEPKAPPPARTADFPDPGTGTLGDLVKQLPEGPQLAPTGQVFDSGDDSRVGFGLFERNGDQVADAQAAVYVASADQQTVVGPFPARSESLAVKPQFQSQTSASDPDSARFVYAARATFPKAKRAIVVAIIRRGSKLFKTNAIGVTVGSDGPPRVGDAAMKVSTPTVSEVGRDLERIDTRIPPSPDMHRDDLAEVIGKRPVVLTFATPRLCQSRVCGPVVDEILQLQAEFGDRASFIHQEIYRDNEVSKGFQSQVRAWKLPTEPWVFTIDAAGKVAGRIEGAASIDEYRAIIERALSS